MDMNENQTTETAEITEKIDKRKGKGNHNHHKRNVNYEGLTDEEKKKAITKSYYEAKGRLYYAKKNRIKNYDMTENDFKDCLTIEDMDLIVKQHLINSGLCEKMVDKLLSKSRRPNKLNNKKAD